MNIDKFKHQHLDILRSIDLLRQLTHAGVERNAAEIAQRIVAMSSTIKLHLAVEDQALYPALQRSGNASLARMGRQYQSDMGPIASAYDAFARRWNTAEKPAHRREGLPRRSATWCCGKAYERMQRGRTAISDPRIEEQEAVHA